MRSLAAVFFGSAAVALGQSGAPVNLSISSQFHIGDGFTLSLTTNLPNQSFTPCGSQNGGPPNCAANFRCHRPRRQLEPAGDLYAGFGGRVAGVGSVSRHGAIEHHLLYSEPVTEVRTGEQR